MPGFGHPAMRALITEATGLVPDLPKTAGTRCGRRRPIARTSSCAYLWLTCANTPDTAGLRFYLPIVAGRYRAFPVL